MQKLKRPPIATGDSMRSPVKFLLNRSALKQRQGFGIVVHNPVAVVKTAKPTPRQREGATGACPSRSLLPASSSSAPPQIFSNSSISTFHHQTSSLLLDSHSTHNSSSTRTARHQSQWPHSLFDHTASKPPTPSSIPLAPTITPQSPRDSIINHPPLASSNLSTLSMSDPASSGTSTPAQHKPLVVGRTKPQSPSTPTPSAMSSSTPASTDTPSSNTTPADPPAASSSTPTDQPTKKKEKAPKAPKPPKPAPVVAPLSPALIDLRVGHILRAIAHPNADSLYVSTISMGDPEGTEFTQVDEATGKVVRTVCSGLNGLIPLEELQDRKIITVANLKPVNMRSIKSCAMVLCASPKPKEGEDPHGPNRTVEFVDPPQGSEAGDRVYFEGWEYGEGKGPEKQLNPKKKQWEAIQPGFFTGEDLSVGFDAAGTEVEGDRKGKLVVEGKGDCSVKSLKGAGCS